MATVTAKAIINESKIIQSSDKACIYFLLSFHTFHIFIAFICSKDILHFIFIVLMIATSPKRLKNRNKAEKTGIGYFFMLLVASQLMMDCILYNTFFIPIWSVH